MELATFVPTGGLHLWGSTLDPQSEPPISDLELCTLGAGGLESGGLESGGLESGEQRHGTHDICFHWGPHLAL